MLDADIREFFTSLDHRWLMRFLEHRIADKRVLRLIGKWLSAGVIEDGAWTAAEAGAPQGASISPLLANVYLHHVLDLWAEWWRPRTRAVTSSSCGLRTTSSSASSVRPTRSGSWPTCGIGWRSSGWHYIPTRPG